MKLAHESGHENRSQKSNETGNDKAARPRLSLRRKDNTANAVRHDFRMHPVTTYSCTHDATKRHTTQS
jgi:hypothetical protein